MADPLSIAGSVVGITAAGVQASVKLYALTEKVATASQRVTSIADDVSSTCAILNQVRELIVPQPDAQGTLKSVFNSVALSDISHALQRCRSVFTEIEILLRQAFEQVGKRHGSHSKIQLSRFEKAKWPFLQPQFDDLRTDLRDSKSNLMLMVAVASLALARRDGHQRPVHANERLELGSAIVQLQRARTMETNNGNTSANFLRQKMGLLKHFGIRRNTKTEGHSMAERCLDTSREHIPGSSAASTTQASLSKLHQDATVSSVVGKSVGFPPRSDSVNLRSASPGPNRNARSQEQELLNDSSLSHGTTEATLANLPSTSSSKQSARLQTSNSSYKREKILSPGQDVLEKSTASSPTCDPTLNLVVLSTSTATPSGAHVSDHKWYYQGWSTDYLTGLRTGYGDSLFVRPMNLPNRSLERLVKAYKDQDFDPYVTMLELTQEQKSIIAQTYATESAVELVYINVSQNTTISSVFGVLEITTLKWILASRTSFSLKVPSSTEVAPPFSPHRNEDTIPPRCYTTREAEHKGKFLNIIQLEKQEMKGESPSVMPHSSQVPVPQTPPRTALSLSSFEELELVNPESQDAIILGDSELMIPRYCVVNALEDDVQSYTGSAHSPVDADHQVYAVSDEDIRPQASRKELFPGFGRRGDTVHHLQHPVEMNEDDIVDELLARWTTS